MRRMMMTVGKTRALRAACGNIAARRGSTLILVVATLALLAILTVAYVSIGGGDRRAARTTTRAAEVERQAEHVADYLVGIVGDDALSVYFQGFDPAEQPIFMTEAVDVPFTDPNRTFDGLVSPTTPVPQANYYGQRFTPTGSLPPLRPSDDPTDRAEDLFEDMLPFGPSDPFLAASEPTYIREAGDAFSDPAYLDRIDWPKISNISPNGLYVNLFTLRGDFDVEPGVNAGQMSDPAVMFLLERGGGATRDLAYGGTADPEVPAHFDSHQIGMFRPVTFAPPGVDATDPEFPLYQYADADGDGFFDSRWQELIDVTATNGPRSVIPVEGQLRWFVAARIVDLSGRVDVNTARGLLQVDGAGYGGQPDNANRLGSSPAEIEFRRLLVMEPQWSMFGEFYDSAPQPGTPGAQDYADYDDYIDDALPVGETGYWAYRQTLEGFSLEPGALPLAVPPLTAAERRGEYESLRYSGSAPLRTSQDDLFRQYGFGLEDLRDLLAFEGLNDPASLSALERAIGGRDEATNPTFSPLRENRSLEVERDLTDPDAALALRHTSVRRQLTTLSGGILRVPTPVVYTSATPTVLDVFTSISSLSDNTIAQAPEERDASIRQDGYRLLQAAAPTDLPTANPTGEAEQRLLRNAHPLFRTYASALAPSAGEPDAWDPSQTAWDSTFYGWDPATGVDRLFSLRTAAHLTANMIDAFDGDDIPSAFTLLVQGDSASRGFVEGAPDLFPWWTEPPPAGGTGPFGQSGRLDLGEERLPQTTAEASGVLAMNVYGLEVHPFITQVSLYNIFTDSPEAAPSDGDAEYVPPTGPGGGPVFGPGGAGSNPITVEFDTDLSNSDFVGQVFAVQLTNPYTTDIEVRDDQFFVQFGSFSGLSSSSPLPGGLEIPAGTTIPAGESIVVYATSDGIQSRATIAAAAFFPVSGADVGAWIDTHLTVNNPSGTTNPVRLFGDVSIIDDFLAGPVGAVSGDGTANREISLWTRLNRDGGDVTEVMLDRLFDPGDPADRPTLDRRPPAVNVDVDTTVAGPETGTAADAIDNTGFSLVTWGTIARPTGSVVAPRGALPAYLLEKRFDAAGSPLNATATDPLTLPSGLSATFSLTRGQFVGGGKLRSAERSLTDIFGDASGTSGATAQIPSDISLDVQDTTHGVRETVEPADQIDGLEFADLYANPLRNDNRGRLDTATDPVDMLRPGDFLGVPAMGPVQMPGFFGGTIDPAVLSWFTTAELLTLALGYDEAPTLGFDDSYPSLPETTFGLLDRGHVSLDRPAPFVDVDGNGVFDAGIDERRGVGIPHAMALLSNITTLRVPVDSRTPIAGLVNLNTATEAATTVLPGLTPTDESRIVPTAAWIDDGTQVLHDHRSDIGASVRSYRDKSAARPKGANPGTRAIEFFDASSVWGDLDPTGTDGRQFVTGFVGLREDFGFMSVGELMAVDVPPSGGGGTGLGGASYPDPLLIRRLGKDGFSLNVDGIDQMRYTAAGEIDQAAGTPDLFDDEIADDYDEQLALFNGVANTVSVRSDVYAIWFVLHGYAREDVEGLRPDDPLTPSVARRYLIVVDRSNVLRVGDRPRVLLFDELPL